MNQGRFPVTLIAMSDPLQVTIAHTPVASATPGDIVLDGTDITTDNLLRKAPMYIK